MLLYLDIDGVCLCNGSKPAPYVFEFLRWAVTFHQPHWLTTRDAHGQHDGILRAFRHALASSTLPAEVETLLRAIRPTVWSGSKVSGIDLASDFVWIDDQPLRCEVDALRDLDLLSRLLLVDASRDDYALLRAIHEVNLVSARSRATDEKTLPAVTAITP